MLGAAIWPNTPQLFLEGPPRREHSFGQRTTWATSIVYSASPQLIQTCATSIPHVCSCRLSTLEVPFGVISRLFVLRLTLGDPHFWKLPSTIATWTLGIGQCAVTSPRFQMNFFCLRVPSLTFPVRGMWVMEIMVAKDSAKKKIDRPKP